MAKRPKKIDDTEEERRAHLAKYNEMARVTFMGVASEMLEHMQQTGVAEAASCVMTGLLEAAVQTWVNVAFQMQVTPGKSRATLEAEVRRLYLFHLTNERKAAAAPPARPVIENQEGEADA